MEDTVKTSYNVLQKVVFPFFPQQAIVKDNIKSKCPYLLS